MKAVELLPHSAAAAAGALTSLSSVCSHPVTFKQNHTETKSHAVKTKSTFDALCVKSLKFPVMSVKFILIVEYCRTEGCELKRQMFSCIFCCT